MGRTTRLRVLLGLFCLLGVALLAVTSQSEFSTAQFEFGVAREFGGVLTDDPVPSLLVQRPGVAGSVAGPSSRYLLVAPFKFGADELIAEHLGEHVSLRGSLIYRDDQTMIELEPGSIEALDGPRPAPVTGRSRGKHTYRGEIVDSKCYLGVMKPGNLKPHRACATNCIRGGIPPVLLIRTTAGAQYVLLVDEDGSAVNDRVLPFVAEPIEIEGEVFVYGKQRVLRASPDTYRRL